MNGWRHIGACLKTGENDAGHLSTFFLMACDFLPLQLLVLSSISTSISLLGNSPFCLLEGYSWHCLSLVFGSKGGRSDFSSVHAQDSQGQCVLQVLLDMGTLSPDWETNGWREMGRSHVVAWVSSAPASDCCVTLARELACHALYHPWSPLDFQAETSELSTDPWNRFPKCLKVSFCHLQQEHFLACVRKNLRIHGLWEEYWIYSFHLMIRVL